MSAKPYARAWAFAALVIAAVGISAAEAGMLTLDLAASPSSVEVNKPMTLTISATSDEVIAAFGFHLVYDGSLLTLDGVAIAPPFEPIAAPGAEPADVAGYLPFGAVQGPNPVLLATATFTAKATGKPTVSIGVSPDDPLEGFVAISPDGTGGTGGGGGNDIIKVLPEAITPVELELVPPGGGGSSLAPEPLTILLLLGGLLVMRPRRSYR